MKRHRARVVVVLVTCPTEAVAKRLSNALVQRRLAACVNLLPGIASTYWWQGKVERSREVLLLIKTTASRFERLRGAITRLHPYDVPEILALPIAAGHPPYLQWVVSSLA